MKRTILLHLAAAALALLIFMVVASIIITIELWIQLVMYEAP
jgi:hypothetical protein